MNCCAFHAGDQHVVVSSLHRLLHLTLHIGQRAVQYRHIKIACVPIDAIEAVLSPHGELVGQIPLFGAQKTQTEAAPFLEHGEHAGVVTVTDQNERRIERYGTKTVDRQPVRLSVESKNTRYGNARGKLRAAASKFASVQELCFSSTPIS